MGAETAPASWDRIRRIERRSRLGGALRSRVAMKQTRPRLAEAFGVTRGAVKQVQEVLRGHGIPDTAVSASRLNLQSVWNFNNNERKFLGYACAASFVIEVRELEVLAHRRVPSRRPENYGQQVLTDGRDLLTIVS